MIMIEITNVKIAGLEPAILGIRNAYSSWDKSDTIVHDDTYVKKCWNEKHMKVMDYISIGPADHHLAETLVDADEPHCKFRRMIQVWMNIRAPRYWWPEFDTYKVGTTANSESTMHTLTKRKFKKEDFYWGPGMPDNIVKNTIDNLNQLYDWYKDAEKNKNKQLADNLFINMKALMPEGKMQLRTVNLNYSVLSRIYKQRRTHRLPEWQDFCDMIELMPYQYIITGKPIPYKGESSNGKD